jgi:hypothetical protein
MVIIRDWKTYYTTKEAKDFLNKSLLKDAEELNNNLSKIKSKEDLCIK